MDIFDPFVIPFTIGTVFIFIAFIYKIIKWIYELPRTERKKILKGLFSKKFFSATWEVIRESLLHFRIFKQNPVLGFMHFSLAFGWFMLIVIGNLESKIYAGSEMNPIWVPIFFDFFVHDKSSIPFEPVFAFFMDFFLLLVLSGVLLANIKRFMPSLFGMKRTTKLRLGDTVALYSLWLIFPFRLLAESFTAGIDSSGGFMTSAIGQYASTLFDLHTPAYISWWAYSIALGTFLVALPFSRYLHILSEVVLIYLRQFGISSYNEFNGFAKLEIDSCSRCGICIDKCQINFVLNNTSVAPSYFIRNLRYDTPDDFQTYSCMLCGRCQDACPVKIDINNIRLVERYNKKTFKSTSFNYLPDKNIEKTTIAYFAGCMTHLTPSIIISMRTIFNYAGVDWTFIDENGGACCGRPLKMTGDFYSAFKLMEYNKKIILESGAKTLITSCPICLKTFKEDYNLNIEILHHSQFINNLIKENKLNISKSNFKTIVYHDPCELGRGLNIYDEPRNVLQNAGILTENEYSYNKSLCCGGSLSNTYTNDEQRNKIAFDTFNHLNINKPDIIATACPLCKKTFKKFGENKVRDIAEVVVEQLNTESQNRKHLKLNKKFDIINS